MPRCVLFILPPIDNKVTPPPIEPSPRKGENIKILISYLYASEGGGGVVT